TQESTEKVFDIIYIVSYSLCVIFFSILFWIHYKLRKNFHPIFNFYLSLMLVAYILCDSFYVAYTIFGQFEDDENKSLSDSISSISYSYILPLVFFAALERLAATILVSRYECLRPWRFVIASQIACVRL
ncbi:hypothetical protein PMAYCL1PPCAC_16849, partial [Pristionchus mayeri]